MEILFTNIKGLLQVRPAEQTQVRGAQMKELPVLENAWLYIRDGKIADFGTMADCPNFDCTISDLSGRYVLPGWCDSHTHLVYAGTREQEFVDRINGLSYEQIYQRGGGILNSVAKLRNLTEDELYAQSVPRLREVMALGTTSIEIKSGYGLDLESELKMLRVIRRLAEEFPVAIRATFLGAHAVPSEFKGDIEAYTQYLIDSMLPAVAQSGLADYSDVFCETGYFSVEQTQRIIQKATELGIPSKIHINQFTVLGGIGMCVNEKVVSVDHLEVLDEADITALNGSSTIAVALPTCSYFISIPYTPVRKLLENDICVALASDYNPGTTPSGNMNLVVATACIKNRMTPEEALNAATLNGAAAMGLADQCGSITIGKRADLIITQPLDNWYLLPYSFGSNLIEQVWVKGERI